MTFNECCDEIAKKRGFTNYKDFCKNALVSTYMMEEICQLYAKGKVKDTIKLARVVGNGEMKTFNPDYAPKYTEEYILKQLEL